MSHPAGFVVWFIIGLVFLSVLLDYAPKIGAGVVILLVLYLAFKVYSGANLGGVSA